MLSHRLLLANLIFARRFRKINAMDTYFYQMVERVLREELAVAFGESQQEAGRRLLEVLR